MLLNSYFVEGAHSKHPDEISTGVCPLTVRSCFPIRCLEEKVVCVLSINDNPDNHIAIYLYVFMMFVSGVWMLDDSRTNGTLLEKA